MTPSTITRYIRQARTASPVAVTATGAAAAQAYDALLLADWVRADVSPNMPMHNWAQSGFKQAYDAAKYCGDYSAGYQHAYATAVCYTLKIHADALVGDDCDLESLAVTLFGDRWLADGAILSAVLSASATPPTWAEMLAGDHTAALMAVTPSNTGTDSSVTATATWTTTDAPAYVHLVLRLADYSTHRGAWIEGSAMLDAASIDLTFSRSVTADTATDPADLINNLVVPIRLYAASANRTPVAYTGANVNLESTHLRRHWTADMLRGGEGAADTPDDVAALCPIISASGVEMTATGHIAKAWCPISAVAGSTLWLRAVGSSWPTYSSIRVSLFTGADMPAVDKASTWAGSGDSCIGTATFSGVSAGDVLGIPLSADASSPLWIVCAFEQISVNDTSFGAADTGFSLLDAHIAALPVTTDATPHFVMLGVDAGTPVGLIRDAAGTPEMLFYYYAMNRAYYVGRKVCSFTWATPGAITGLWMSLSIHISGSADHDFAAGVDEDGVLRLACDGTLPAALTNLEGGSGYAATVALYGQTLATLDDTGAVAAVSGALGAALAGAINTAAVANGAYIRGYDKCLLIQDPSQKVQAVGAGLNATFVSNVAALTSRYNSAEALAIGNTWACFIKSDFTAVAYALADGSADATVAGWTNVVAISTAHNAIVAVNTSGKLLVANGAAYAGLDSTSIAALNALYVFHPSIIANVGASGPEFAVAVKELV